MPNFILYTSDCKCWRKINFPLTIVKSQCDVGLCRYVSSAADYVVHLHLVSGRVFPVMRKHLKPDVPCSMRKGSHEKHPGMIFSNFKNSFRIPQPAKSHSNRVIINIAFVYTKVLLEARLSTQKPLWTSFGD